MSIKDHALLVSLSVQKPQMSKKDDKATRDAESANDAHGAGQFRKELYPRQLVQPILAVESSARAYIDTITYPWSRGLSLLPSKRFMEFADRMAKYEVEFRQAVTAFLNNWSNVMLIAQSAQGALFDADAYPDLSALQAMFRMKVAYYPVTDAGDFRVQIQDEHMQLLKAQAEADARETIEATLKAPLERLRKTVERLHEVAGKEDRFVTDKRGIEVPKPPIFRDSVVDNIRDEISLLMDIAEILPTNTVAVATRISEWLPPAQQLRDDPDVRVQTHKKTEHLLKALDAMLED